MSEMEFGLSRVCITPEFKTCLACSQKKDTLFKRIHDDIFVGCVFISDFKEKILILTYDLLFHSRDLHSFVQNYASLKYGIKEENILINFSHNHNSPSTLGYNDFSASEEYEIFLREKTCDTIDLAFDKMEPGNMEYGEIEGHWAVNRRKPTPDGIKLAPNPAGPVDDRIYLLRLSSKSGKTKGLIMNYACHPVHYPDTLALTSEYPGFLCKYIEEKIPGCTPIFIQGAGANARPAGTVEGDSFVHRSFEYIQEMASGMGEAIISYLAENNFKEVTPDFYSVSFDVRIPTEDKRMDYFKNQSIDESLSAHLRRNALAMLSDYKTTGVAFTLTCGIIKLSADLFIVHMGGEPCCEVKFNLMGLFNDSGVIFAGYTDGCSYIVTDRMILEGGYEVDCFLEYLHKGRIKPGIDTLINDSFESALNQIKS